jgi:HEPN domain-containing protein
MADSTDYKMCLKRADQDMLMAEIVLSQGGKGLEEAICYTCQQAAEKFLKAFILYNTHEMMRTHDLRFLLGKCIEINSTFSSIEENVKILNEYSVAARYPGDFVESYTLDDARQAYEHAIAIKNKIISCI